MVATAVRIQAMAQAVFASRDDADAWLRERNGALADQVPLALLDTETGVRLVEAVLGRIAHGVVEQVRVWRSMVRVFARRRCLIVMAGFVPAIQSSTVPRRMAGTSPAMTVRG